MSVGQRVVITGGASGIGFAMAQAFAREGARVAVCDVDDEALSAFRDAYPAGLAARADVSDASSMDDFLRSVEGEFDGADVVCSNAGTGGPTGPVEEMDLPDWRACLSTNLDGAFLTSRWAARVMKTQGSGLLLFTASTAGQYGYPLRAPYAAAKWGIVGLMKTLAMELGPHGVRVNVISPGSVQGDRMTGVIEREAASRGQPVEEVRQTYVKGVSMRTFIDAEDIANAAVFLASPAGARISGQTLAVDGNTETLAP
jgi:NAD(P)-dependent dehydrogenase (short-subunit alcohol dehydrogenase family)